MKPGTRRVVWSVLVPAGVGGCVAAIVCGCVVWFVRSYDGGVGAQSKGSHHEQPMVVSVSHPPPVPVSPPLVRPTIAIKDETKTTQPSVVSPVMASVLPSFAPLVRQVIPAVVNISISRDRETHHSLDKTRISDPPPDEAAEDEGKGQRRHHVRPHNPELYHHRASLKHHHTTTRRRVIHPADDDMGGAGSGFVVDASGIIVTNRHVVGGASHVMVSLSDGRVLPARILGDDPMTDIAVIKVESSTRLPCVTWGDSRQVEIGDWIMVAGNPFGFGSSVTAGIVSAVGRDLGIGALDDFMQLDAPINPGNSGGPAFNLHGQVVAVNAAIASPSDGSVGIGFGIPAEIVAPIVESIEKTGHVEHGWLGVTLNDASSPMWVEDVDRNGAAWHGGLREKDEILAMGNVAVHDARTVLRSVAAAHPGTVFMFTIRRHGDVKTLAITLGQRPASDL